MTTPPPPSNVVPIIRRRPGRPRVVRPPPDHDEREYVEKLAELAHEGIENDPLVLAMDDHELSPAARLDILIEALARESAGLLFDREALQRENRADGIPQLCSRRIDCLTKLSRLVVEREVLQRQSGEMSDETVAKLVGMLVAPTEEVVREISPAEADAFMSLLNEKVARATWTTR